MKTFSAAILGVVFHWTIHNIEFEKVMFHFIAVSMALFFGSIYALFKLGQYSLTWAVAKTCFLAASFNAGLLASIAIYRLVFHRCRHFPGPLGAKLSRFYAASLSAKNVQYYKEIAKIHEEYGDFVRTGTSPSNIPELIKL